MEEKQLEFLVKYFDAKLDPLDERLDKIESKMASLDGYSSQVDKLNKLEKSVEKLHDFKTKTTGMFSVVTFIGSLVAFMIGTFLDFIKVK